MPKTLRTSLKWLFPVALLGAFAALGVACGSSDGSGDSTSGTSGGNGCVPGAQSSCDCPGAPGLGVQVCNATGSGFEACDCTNIGNTGSTGTGSTTCGNAVVDEGEECDDGNSDNTDGCNTACTTPSCGNGIVDQGEDCDDGNNSEFDACPSDCQQGGTGGMGAGGMGQGGDPCEGVLTYAGMITGMSTPFTFGVAQGVKAADSQCQAQLGADHMCTYAEVQAALAAGELNNDVNILNAGAAGLKAWVYRTTTEKVNAQHHPDPAGVDSVGDDPNNPQSDYTGGNCNRFTYTTNHISDGEYVDLTSSGGVTSALFWLDNDTFYDGVNTGHAIAGELQCNGISQAVLCCYPVCKP